MKRRFRVSIKGQQMDLVYNADVSSMVESFVSRMLKDVSFKRISKLDIIIENNKPETNALQSMNSESGNK